MVHTTVPNALITQSQSKNQKIYSVAFDKK